MTQEATRSRGAVAKTRPKSAGARIACMVFVAAMGAAFWIGTLWASHAWIGAG